MTDYYVDDLSTAVYQFELFNHNNSNYLIWVLLSERDRKRQRDRQTDRQADRQTERDRETERQIERQIERQRETEKERDTSAINNVRISNDFFINWWKE